MSKSYGRSLTSITSELLELTESLCEDFRILQENDIDVESLEIEPFQVNAERPRTLVEHEKPILDEPTPKRRKVEAIELIPTPTPNQNARLTSLHENLRSVSEHNVKIG